MTTHGPQPWDGAHLRAALCVVEGVGPRHGPLLTRVATELAITPRTLQRWMHTHPPTTRISELATLLGPTPQVLHRETLERRFARQSQDALTLPHGRYVNPAWIRSGWHKPHRLSIVQVPAPIDVLVLTQRIFAIGSRQDRDTHAHITLDFNTYFDALLGKHLLLQDVRPWRIAPPAQPPEVGATTCWLALSDPPSYLPLPNRAGPRDE